MRVAAAYIRVSDSRQDEFSPDSQLKLIREYCVRNDILLPDELVFYDDGISAKSVKKRKQFNDMISLAKQQDKPFDVILVWKFSRFARNQEESIVYKSLLRKHGVEVISISEPIADSQFGGLIERIIEWMDEFYLTRLSDEVRRGMTERATRGLPNVAPPFGYYMENGLYKIDQQQAPIVRQIFEQYAAGVPTLKIVEALIDQGVVNKRGNPIDNRGIEYMVNNPCYKGDLRWNPSGRSASARVFNNPSDIVTYNTHEPIIDIDLWNEVQKRVQERNALPKYSHANQAVHEHMLRGLLKCSSCGSTLVYSKSNKGFQCHRYSKGTCSASHCISANKASNWVIEEIKKDLNDLNFEISTAPILTMPVVDIDYTSLINAEKLKLDRAKQAYQAGVDSLEEYRLAKNKIEKQIEQYKEKRRKSGIKYAALTSKRYTKQVTDVLKLLETPQTPPELKNSALKSIVEKIIFHRAENRLEIFYKS